MALHIKIKCILSFLIIFCACTSQKYSDKSHAHEYQKEAKALDAEYVIYHNSDDQSRIYYSIDNKNVVYKKVDTNQVFTASLKLFYQIISTPDSKVILDSGSFVIKDRKAVLKSQNLTGYVSFTYKAGSSGYIEILLRDENRKTEDNVQLHISKQNSHVSQNFLLKEPDSTIVLNSHVKLGTNLTIEHHRLPNDKLIVEWYKQDFKLPPPPFREAPVETPKIKADSIFELPLLNDCYSLLLNNPGVYIFKNSQVESGCTIFVSDSDFPKVATHQQMIACTRYILSKDEFEALLNSADKKKAIEQHWLTIGGNNDRARELIRKYYGRVQNANILFSTSEEGWRTDRGMIYIVFGAPLKVYKTLSSEIWIYGNDKNGRAIMFKFDKKSNNFMENEYFLNRSAEYKDIWYLAVTAWRDGNIFSDN